MGWLLSRYPRDTHAAIKEMKRSGMDKPLPVIQVPNVSGSSNDLDSLYQDCSESARKVTELQDSAASRRTEVHEVFAKYADTLGSFGEKLAEYAGTFDQSLANAACFDFLLETEKSILAAKNRTELKHAVQFAELARISMFCSIAMALSAYAIKIHTAADRVTALQATDFALKKCEQFKQEYGL